MESKIKNYLENDDGFMDYTRKRTRAASEEVDDHVAETKKPNAIVSNSSNTTQHVFNDTLNKLMMFSDYCMDSTSNTKKDGKGKEIVSSPREISQNRSPNLQMTEFDKTGAYTPRIKVEGWSEVELDALWMGVQKYGEGNWNAILEDSSLPLLRDKTLEEMAARWKEETSKVLPVAEPLPINTMYSNGTSTTMPFPGSGIASHASDFSFLKLLAKMESESLKKKNSDMNMGRQEMVTTIANSDETVVQPKLLLCGHFELPIVRKKKRPANNDAGGSMENPVEIDE